ncbi:MAG: amidohydrolase family protein [Clostridia bacterium]|nr:amidohydrolase family protein [Clostridia bacterium]
MIIDFHTHVFPDAIAPAAIGKLQANSHILPFSDGTLEGLRAGMAAGGVDVSVVLPVATGAKQVPHINDSAIRLNRQAGETGVYSFGGMHPDFPDWEKEMERLAAAGVRGIKLHPPYQGVDLDDPRYIRIFKKASRLGMLVITHAGLDVGLPGAEEAAPEKILRAVEKAPDTPLILAHMGGWRCWDEVEKLLPGAGVYLDTSFALGKLTPNGDGHYKNEKDLEMLGEEQFLRLVFLFGADHILFGTDSPWADPAAYLQSIRDLPLPEADLQAILGGNAERLLFV